jgi:thiamine biosynthesis lipoprotein
VNAVVLACEAMRTRFELILPELGRPEADRRAAGEAALAEIAIYEHLLSAYRPGAELWRVNAGAAAGPVRTDARVIDFLATAADLSVATEGAFDPTVGPLLALWGIGGDRAAAQMPDADAVARAVGLTGMVERVAIDRDLRTVRYDRPGVRVDPGAIGKGYALDRAVEALRDAGVNRALLHGGTSSVAGIGFDESDGWRVGVRDPARGGLIAEATLRDESLSVSAVERMGGDPGDNSWGHVIDPRSGMPVTGNLLAAAVAASGAIAEALSTALLVGGEAGLEMLSSRFPTARLLLVTRGPTGVMRTRTVGEGWARRD